MASRGSRKLVISPLATFFSSLKKGKIFVKVGVSTSFDFAFYTFTCLLFIRPAFFLLLFLWY